MWSPPCAAKVKSRTKTRDARRESSHLQMGIVRDLAVWVEGANTMFETEPALRIVWKALRAAAAESRGLGLARGCAVLRVLNSVSLGGTLAAECGHWLEALPCVALDSLICSCLI